MSYLFVKYSKIQQVILLVLAFCAQHFSPFYAAAYASDKQSTEIRVKEQSKYVLLSELKAGASICLLSEAGEVTPWMIKAVKKRKIEILLPEDYTPGKLRKEMRKCKKAWAKKEKLDATPTPKKSTTPAPKESATPNEKGTSTPLKTHTKTATPRASEPGTNIPIASPTRTPTPRNSLPGFIQPTNAATNSPTQTSTRTYTSTPTRSSTYTYTATATRTSTPTQTFIRTNTSTATATSTPTRTMTLTATPSRTATSTPTTAPSHAPQNSALTAPTDFDLGQTGSSEPKVVSIVVKPNNGFPTIDSKTISGSGAISILSNSETVQRGGIPCSGPMGQFCVVMLRVQGTAGSHSGQLTIRHTLPSAGINNAPHTINLYANISPGATKFTHSFTTISAKARANSLGKPLSEYLIDEFVKIAPANYSTSDPLIFSAYTPGATSTWMPSWANSVLDLSGVAWDMNQAGTAVTLCHVVYARHFQRSGPIVFTKKDGTRFQTNIINTVSFPELDNAGGDVTVGRLNPCLPQDWTVYPLLDPNDIPTTSTMATMGSFTPYFNTHFNFSDSIRRISVTRVRWVAADTIWGDYFAALPGHMQVMASGGDSGNPSFFVFEGKQVLASTFTFGGWGGGGPFYAMPSRQQRLREAIAALP